MSLPMAVRSPAAYYYQTKNVPRSTFFQRLTFMPTRVMHHKREKLPRKQTSTKYWIAKWPNCSPLLAQRNLPLTVGGEAFLKPVDQKSCTVAGKWSKRHAPT